MLRLLAAAFPPTASLALTAIAFALLWSVLLGLLIWSFPRARLTPVLRVLPGAAGALPIYWTSILIVQFAALRLGLFSAFDPTGPAAVTAAARARGASRGHIIRRYVWRAILIPVLNVVAIVFGTVMTSTIVTEHVFGRTGIGSLMYRSIVEQDLPMVQGVVLLAALLFVLANLLVDILALVLDKRNRPWLQAAAAASADPAADTGTASPPEAGALLATNRG